MKLNSIVYYKTIVKSLEKRKQELMINISKTHTPEYFKTFKNNPLCEWGQVCMSKERAEKELQELYDQFEKALEETK